MKEKTQKKQRNETMLLVPKKLYEDCSLFHYAITTYCILKNLHYHNPLFSECISVQQLIYHFMGSIPNRRNRIYSYIEQGIEELHFGGYIQITKVQQKHYLLDCENMWINTDSEYFSNITFQEVQRIFQIEGVNNYCLLRYFIILMGTLVAKITVMLPNGIQNLAS